MIEMQLSTISKVDLYNCCELVVYVCMNTIHFCISYERYIHIKQLSPYMLLAY